MEGVIEVAGRLVETTLNTDPFRLGHNEVLSFWSAVGGKKITDTI